MAKIPEIKTLTNSSVDVLNAIRNSASMNYRDHVPIASPDAESIKGIGAVIMDYPALQNEFLSALINRIARVTLTSKNYSNPLALLKKGFLEFGETIEEIFVDIANIHQYDPETAVDTVFEREIPDVRSAFHVLNYQKFYKDTIDNDRLRKAFLNIDGITSLIAGIVESMYKSESYDEYLVMKYLVAKNALAGHTYAQEIQGYDTEAHNKATLAIMKAVSNDMTFLKTKYNLAGVRNDSPKSEQVYLVDATFDAFNDVNVLASAFNLDKVEFMGRRILVDGFSFDTDEVARLNEIFANDPSYTQFTSQELALLADIVAVVADSKWFQCYDNLAQFTEIYNNEGLSWNYTYHVWKTFSSSPFSNIVVYATDIASDSAPTYAMYWNIGGNRYTDSAQTVSKGAEFTFTAERTAGTTPTFLNTGLTYKLQSSADSGTTWTDVATDVGITIVNNKVKVASTATAGLYRIVGTFVFGGSTQTADTLTFTVSA